MSTLEFLPVVNAFRASKTRHQLVVTVFGGVYKFGGPIPTLGVPEFSIVQRTEELNSQGTI